MHQHEMKNLKINNNDETQNKKKPAEGTNFREQQHYERTKFVRNMKESRWYEEINIAEESIPQGQNLNAKWGKKVLLARVFRRRLDRQAETVQEDQFEENYIPTDIQDGYLLHAIAWDYPPYVIQNFDYKYKDQPDRRVYINVDMEAYGEADLMRNYTKAYMKKFGYQSLTTTGEAQIQQIAKAVQLNMDNSLQVGDSVNIKCYDDIAGRCRIGYEEKAIALAELELGVKSLLETRYFSKQLHDYARMVIQIEKLGNECTQLNKEANKTADQKMNIDGQELDHEAIDN